MKAETRIGISGWTYGPWRGVFYPDDLPQKRELEYASRKFNSIEINGSFYSLQRPSSYQAWTKTDANRRVRHCVEIRHHSFCDERFVKLCRRHRIAIVFADTAGKWPYVEDVTADFIYARLHGDEELYVSGYTDAALDWWA